DVALINRLDLMTSRDQVVDAERRVRIAERDLLPDLGIEAVGRRASAPDSRHGDDPLEHDTWSLGFVLELPLRPVRERNAPRGAKMALDGARRELSLAEDSAILSVREALRNLRSAEASLSIQEQIVASEEKNAKIAKMRFDNGEISNRDLTDAYSNLADAQNR